MAMHDRTLVATLAVGQAPSLGKVVNRE
jgi:hypothetical protein